jgi:hypothetical protein
MKQDRNIHIISTEKPRRYRGGKVSTFTAVASMMPTEFIPNMYITSNEEIKEGDWVITYNGLLAKVITEFEWHFKNSKKIILTTDQDLIKDGVQAIDDDFLEWFVKNPSCESVEVEYGDDGNGYQIIPKEEPNPFELSKALPDDVFVKSLEELKQETLEELAERLKGKELFKESNDRARETLSEIKSSPKQETLEEREPYWDLVDKKAEQNNTIDLDAYAKGVQDGAKWQQKQDKKLYNEVFEWLANKDYLSDKVEPIQKEFEQFKKK